MRRGFQFQIKVVADLMAYVFRLRPYAVLPILVGTMSSILEVSGLMILIPLTRFATNVPFPPNSPWYRFAELLGSQPTVRFYIVAFFALMFARTFTQLAATVLVNSVIRKINTIFSTRALEAFIHHLSFVQVQRESIGHFVSVAGEEAVRASMIVGAVIRLVPLLILFLIYLALISYQSWQIGVGFVLFCLCVAACLFSAFKKVLQLGARQQLQSREAGTHFIESLSGLRTVRSFNAEGYAVTRYRQMMEAYMRTLFFGDALTATGSAVPTLLLTGGMLGLVTLAVSPNQLALMLPAIIVGIMTVLRLLPLATQTLDTVMRLTSDLKAAENISEMLAAIKSADEADRASLTHMKEPITIIEFDKIFFRYDEKLPPVFENYSVSFAAGKTYAITGPSGAGKSTIVDLLLKFYAPQGGTVRVNGKDIQTLSNESLRRHVVLAEQAVRMFYDTIEHNVQFGRDASSEDVTHALDMVGLSELIASLPDGQKTLLNYQGSNVSGGQRQRIGLARALLLKADVLIMDESTSALDKATRDRILARLLPLYRDRIVIFIAHDPAILDIVDEVIHLGHAALAATAVAG